MERFCHGVPVLLSLLDGWSHVDDVFLEVGFEDLESILSLRATVSAFQSVAACQQNKFLEVCILPAKVIIVWSLSVVNFVRRWCGTFK